MRIRWKTLLIISVIILVLTFSFYFVFETALLKRVSEDENRIAQEDLVRLKMAISSQSETLESKAADWSNWDDSYQFVEDNNSKFIETNLVPEAFSDLKVNLMIFINNSGSIVFGKAYYLNNMTEMSIDRAAIESVINTFSHNNNSELEGFVKTNNDTILIVARPIAKSNYEGPEKGILIFGILLDESKIIYLSNIIGLPVKLTAIDDSKMTADFLKANSTLATSNSVFCTSLTETEISGYIPIKDINLKNIALASIVDSRQGYIDAKSEILLQAWRLLQWG